MVLSAFKVFLFRLILKVHSTTTQNQKAIVTRLIHASFNLEGMVLAASDSSGKLYFIDLLNSKFWALQVVRSCSALEFSRYNSKEAIVASNNGKY